MTMHITAYHLSELLNDPTPAVEWVVRDVVPKNGITFLVAKPGAGKSLLAYDMAACVASGLPWLNAIPTEQGAVAYVDLDGRRSLAKLRANAAIQGRGFSDAAATVLPMYIIGDLSQLDISKQEVRTDLLETLAGIADLRLVVFDTYADLHRGEENSPDDMLDTMYAVLQIAQQMHCGVLIIHHLRKGGTGSTSSDLDDVRGSSAITGKVDAVFLLKQERDSAESAPRLTLLQRKSRLTAEAAPRTLLLETTTTDDGDLISFRFVQGDTPERPKGGRPTERGVPQALLELANYREEHPDATEAEMRQHLTAHGFLRGTIGNALKEATACQNPPQG